MESSYLIHMNPKIWPEPFKFNPQRWIDNPRLSKYLVPFSRGPRNCVGQNLAWAELYMMTAKLFRQFEMELYDTTEERDVLTKFDGFIGLTDRTSDGVRVRIVRERD